MNKMRLLFKNPFSRFGLIAAAACIIMFGSCSNVVDNSDGKNKLSRQVNVDSNQSPAATVQEPLFNEAGVSKNKQIIISFTKSMNPQTFWSNTTITDSLGNNLKSHFELPVWSNDNKTVQITANDQSLIDLSGKKYMDIYIAISKSCEDKNGLQLKSAIEYKYRINDELEINAPKTGAVKASSSKTTLFEGAYNITNEADICKTNHINNKLDFYIEGSDTDGGEVWAHFYVQRLYDVNGKKLAEAQTQKLIKLAQINYTANIYYDTVCVDLSDSTYLDGLYKITAAIQDSTGKDSLETKDYYIIRDTALSFNTSSMIKFEMPAESVTKKKLEASADILSFDKLGDDVFYVSKINNRTFKYYQPYSDYTYLVAWGLSFNKLGTAVELEKYNTSYKLPEEYKDFRADNPDKDICVRVTIIDKVGNQNYIDTLIPKQVDFFNYTYDSTTKKLKLNFADLSNSVSNITSVADTDIYINYSIYYGIKKQSSDISSLELTKVTGSEFTLPVKEGESEEVTDYVFFIQPCYILNSKLTGVCTGQTYGPLYQVNTSSDSSNASQLLAPAFTVSKQSAGENSGKIDITVYVTNPQTGYSYYPCFSTDNKNWNIYKTPVNSTTGGETVNLTFQVVNPYKLPVYDAQWYDRNRDNQPDFESYFTVNKDVQVPAFIKVLAVKGSKSVESAKSYILNFTQDDDNIPPTAIGGSILSHDSKLASDGKEFKFGNVVIEDEFNAIKRFTYYYTDYNGAWGNSLSVLTDEQIMALPGANSYLDSLLYIDDSEDVAKLAYKLCPVIPVNGLKDGQYMFFARIDDLKGNSGYITLGKANVSTFANKLNVQYKNKRFYSTLKLEDNEKLKKYFVNVQRYGIDEEQFECSPSNKTLTNESKPVEAGYFYRITMQGYNEHEFATSEAYVGPEYDTCTEETVSNTVYYYVPAADDDLSGFKNSFFKNTAAFKTNKPAVVNIISSLTDLGSDIDEWERRGKLIKTYYYDGTIPENGFNDSIALNDMYNSEETGMRYFVVVVHFANNTASISNVYTINK